ncbi:Signal transduction histidine kinase [Sporobacter termitidis DSM 10068]|uniref:Stage 0 sporulation protein A homolog n=2 Tax=Sporobacter TaxID=44748 RepID=A0A1M5YGU6_9FIRM|nr:Signal transduction histidine kinase [Sporobacter termitidis DSM 10068]
MAARRTSDKEQTVKKQASVNNDSARQLKLFKIITEHLSDGLIIVRPDRSVAYKNKRAAELPDISGDYKKCGEGLADARYFDEKGKEIEEKDKPVKRVLNGETLDDFHVKAVRPDKTLYLSMSGRPVFISGKLICAIMTIREAACGAPRRGEGTQGENGQAAPALMKELEAAKGELERVDEALNTICRLNSNFTAGEESNAIYEELLRTALSITCARKGSLQVFNENSGTLSMIHGIGLGAEFLEAFHHIDLYSGTCGMACREKKRIFTENLRQLISNSPRLVYIEKEGIAAELSMPLISSAGKIAGVLNIYYDDGRRPPERELRILDTLVRFAADTIERAKAAEALVESRNDAINLLEELRRVDDNKNVFLSTLSHELRNPIASILAALQLLDLAKDAKLIESTKGIIKREAAQLRRLVDDLLDLTRINMKKIELKKEAVDLTGIALAAVEDYIFLFDERGVRLDTNICRDAVYVDADPARITQLIGNLLSNALKFTDDEGGLVELEVCQDGDEAVICVRDNGIGISEEFLPELFEPFKQADTPPDRSCGGLGLGLSIVKGIAELHGGSVDVSSEGLGKGASFSVRLPARREDTAVWAEGRTCQSARPRRVLLIEDNRDLAELLRTTLEMFGHTVAAAFDGVDGVRLAKEFRPEVILCDIGLPGEDGYEVARQLRSEAGLSGVYMAALTGYDGESDIERALAAGFDSHLAKPLDMAAVTRLLETAE